MLEKVYVRFTRRKSHSSVKVVALKAFCSVRVAQRRVAQLPAKAQALARDVADAWKESGRIVPN